MQYLCEKLKCDVRELDNKFLNDVSIHSHSRPQHEIVCDCRSPNTNLCSFQLPSITNLLVGKLVCTYYTKNPTLVHVNELAELPPSMAQTKSRPKVHYLHWPRIINWGGYIKKRVHRTAWGTQEGERQKSYYAIEHVHMCPEDTTNSS